MAEHRLTDSCIIANIRADRELSKMFNELSKDERREVLRILNGDDWRVEEVIEFVLEGRSDG